MKKIFTPKQLDKKNEEVVAPSEKTLEFLKQFARSYHVDRSLPRELNGFCVN